MHGTRAMLAALIGLAVGGCSLAADGGTTRTVERGVGEAGAAASDAAATGAARRKVDPRRGGLELGFGEFAITLEADEIRPGPVTFVVRNRGRLVHGFEIEIEERDSSGPGSGDDDGLKLEGPAFGPGETVRLRTVLAPGVYEVECFVAEHDDMGMRATLVVRRDAPLVRADRSRAATDRVEVGDFSFSPATLEVPAGSEVTWTNADPTAHTVSARDGSFDSGALDPGAAFETTFPEPGTFAYYCQIHPTMRGSVRVLPSA